MGTRSLFFVVLMAVGFVTVQPSYATPPTGLTYSGAVFSSGYGEYFFIAGTGTPFNISPHLDAGTASAYSATMSGSTLEPGITIDPTSGVIHFTPTVIFPSGSSSGKTIQVSASDGISGHPPASVEIGLVVTPHPWLTGLTYTTSNIAGTIFTPITPDSPTWMSGTPTSFTATGLPAGLLINSLTGVISGTPTHIGPSTITVTAHDSFFSSSSPQSFTSTTISMGVTNGSLTGSIVPSSGPHLCPDVITSLSYTTRSGDTVASSATLLKGRVEDLTPHGGTAVSYTFTGTLSRYVTFNATTGVFHWSNPGFPAAPTPTGTFPITVTANGGTACRNPNSASTSFSLVVVNPPFGGLTYDYSSITAFQGVPLVNNRPHLAAGEVQHYTVSPSLPPGVSIDNTGSFLGTLGTIGGTPTVPGTYTPTITATDPYGSTTSTTVSFVVTASLSGLTYTNTSAIIGFPITKSPTLATGVANAAPSPNFTRVGMPAWLNLDSTTGVVTGTPPTAGHVSFIVTAYDTSPITTSFTLNFDVAPQISGFSYPLYNNGIQGTAMSIPAHLAAGVATGGFSVTSGALPPGLTLNSSTGTIGGIPSAGGVFTFNVLASDAVTSLIGQVSVAICPSSYLGKPISVSGNESNSIPLACFYPRPAAYSSCSHILGGIETNFFTPPELLGTQCCVHEGTAWPHWPAILKCIPL